MNNCNTNSYGLLQDIAAGKGFQLKYAITSLTY